MENLLAVREARLLNYFQDKDVAFLSIPKNIEKQGLSDAVDLTRMLQSMGYGFIKIKGECRRQDGVITEEDVFAVINNNIDPNEYHPDFLYNILCLAREFDQENILVRLSGQKPCAYDKNGGIGNIFDELSIAVISEFYSQLKNNKFTFLEEDCDGYAYRRADRAFYTVVMGMLDEKKFKDKYPDLQKFKTK